MKKSRFLSNFTKVGGGWGETGTPSGAKFIISFENPHNLNQSCHRFNPKLLISGCNWCFGMAPARDEIKVVQFHKFLDFPIPIPGTPPDTHRLAGYGWATKGEPRTDHNTAFALTLTLS